MTIAEFKRQLRNAVSAYVRSHGVLPPVGHIIVLAEGAKAAVNAPLAPSDWGGEELPKVDEPTLFEVAGKT